MSCVYAIKNHLKELNQETDEGFTCIALVPYLPSNALVTSSLVNLIGNSSWTN